MSKQLEKDRKKLWIKVYTVVIKKTNNCVYTANKIANIAVSDFNKEFNDETN